ncbi:uncharacterized protein LOC125239725 [Leguminivora glycinivorella]|uniref:uncharacterized protein LOC125239725 n=1 Tax=Leguminivora glycinivorella TaxID=1035111 RepID=UPI00200E9B2C|nr:uncharacterized protein LOC125239725 [Leguminivora glycinivorella]
MSLGGAKYVWVEAKQEQELTENVKMEFKSEPKEMCVVDEIAGAGLYVKQEEPESVQDGHLKQEPEVKAEAENLADIFEPALQAGLCNGQESALCHMDPVVKAVLKEEAERVGSEHESKYSSWIEPVVLDYEFESEKTVSSMSTAEQAGLYLKHEVEDGLVVGPEEYHRATLNKQAAWNPAPDKTCTVSLERMHIDMERSVCRVGPNTYKFILCSHQENDTSPKE